ncbi:Glutamate receptor ionotropic, kainate glr-3 [Frankliniella fusca]|uniref:Glutamate receptor ionotropic, kainate glr-3 n=1 Tax=Frankliniella fusca TaxID=407009 RepID=A0AAE1LPS1_9NEOP|nr:Glutamate receptor ionotropic, kainate glr-3 [Frankliniella fusca]
MPHVSVLLLALAIADKEFAAREPVAVLQQQQPLTLWRPSGPAKQPQRLELELGERLQGQGQGQGRPEERIQGQGQGRSQNYQDLIRDLQLTGRWPLILLACCSEEAGRRRRAAAPARAPAPAPALSRAALFTDPRVGSYVLISTAAALPALVDTVARQPSWNPEALFLVILLDDRDRLAQHLLSTYYEELGLAVGRARAAVDALWARLASRVVVLDALRVFVWSAYSHSSACGNTSAVRMVAEVGEAGAEVARGLFGPPAGAPRLEGCDLRFSAVAWPPYVLSGARNPDRGFDRGLDVQMLRTFARIKRMQLRFVPLADKEERWGDRRNDSSWTGLLGMLQRGEVDVVYGGFYCLPDRVDDFHPTVAYSHEVRGACVLKENKKKNWLKFKAKDPRSSPGRLHPLRAHTVLPQAISWYLPRSQPVPKWQLLYGALPTDAARSMWLVLTLSTVAVLGMQRAQRWRPPEGAGSRVPGRARRGEDGVVQVTLSVMATALDQPPLVFPRTAAPRLFYFTFVFFFFHFNIVFRTAITNTLASSPRLPGLSSYHELAAYGFEVGTASTDTAVDIMLADPDMAFIRDLHKDCEVSECLRKMQRRLPTYGILFSSAVMMYLTPRYFLDGSGVPYVERLPSPALPTFVTMYLRKGHPLARHVDAVFARLVQAGLPHFWLSRSSAADHRVSRAIRQKRAQAHIPLFDEMSRSSV